MHYCTMQTIYEPMELWNQSLNRTALLCYLNNKACCYFCIINVHEVLPRQAAKRSQAEPGFRTCRKDVEVAPVRRRNKLVGRCRHCSAEYESAFLTATFSDSTAPNLVGFTAYRTGRAGPEMAAAWCGCTVASALT